MRLQHAALAFSLSILTAACAKSASDLGNFGGYAGYGGYVAGGAGGASSSTGATTGSGGTKHTGGTTSTGGTKSTGGTTSTGGTKSTGGTTSTGGSSSGPTKPSAVASKLGRNHFLMGMGNDNSQDYAQLGVTLDLHYWYLTNGWSNWNPNGGYVDNACNDANGHGVVPMFTTYAMAGWGENKDVFAVQDQGYMTTFWNEQEILFQRIAASGKPAVVHWEPDFWGFVQTQTNNNNPAGWAAKVKLNSRCSDLPDTITGMAHCLVRIARQVAPKAIVGFHASAWGGTANQTATFFKAIGAGDADIVVIETLDRDAGCYEAGTNSACPKRSSVYWDESNATSPNYKEHLTWARTLYVNIGRPLLWWQMPFGVPSTTPGGYDGHYRDNRVHYVFNNTQSLVDAGGVGAVFGAGAGGQTYIKSDGGQFRNAVNKYFSSPLILP